MKAFRFRLIEQIEVITGRNECDLCQHVSDSTEMLLALRRHSVTPIEVVAWMSYEVEGQTISFTFSDGQPAKKYAVHDLRLNSVFSVWEELLSRS